MQGLWHLAGAAGIRPPWGGGPLSRGDLRPDLLTRLCAEGFLPVLGLRGAGTLGLTCSPNSAIFQDFSCDLISVSSCSNVLPWATVGLRQACAVSLGSKPWPQRPFFLPDLCRLISWAWHRLNRPPHPQEAPYSQPLWGECAQLLSRCREDPGTKVWEGGPGGQLLRLWLEWSEQGRDMAGRGLWAVL